MQPIGFPYPVPYHSQVASPELADAIFSQRISPESDPRWQESGAVTPQEYAYWVNRACGAACVKMIIEALGGPVLPLIAWARLGLASGGYLTNPSKNNPHSERGWLHRALAELISAQGFYAQPLAGDIHQFSAWLSSGLLIIASVSYEIGSDRPITMRGGHLVIVHGLEMNNGTVDEVILHNPSGRRADLQANARIKTDRFSAAFSRRVIIAGPSHSPSK